MISREILISALRNMKTDNDEYYKVIPQEYIPELNILLLAISKKERVLN